MAESKNIESKPADNSSNDKNPKRKPKKKKRILSFITLSFVTLLFVLILLVVFTQTSMFKDWVTGYVLDKINVELAKKESYLTCKSIEGNFFSEIILDSASLKMQKDEMAKIDHIKITFDIFKMLYNQVNISELILANPSVNLFKIKNAKGDSVWNYTYLFSSEEVKPKVVSEFEWKMTVGRIRIDNLNFVMLGGKPFELPISSFIIKTSENLDFNNLKISALDLEASLYYDKNSTVLEISQLNFNSNFGFELKGLSGNFYISKSRAEINKLNIETSRSWLQMDYIFVDQVDLTNLSGLEMFKGKDVRLSLLAKNIDINDLKDFLPALHFLDKDVYLNLKAKGKFDDLQIDKLVLKTANSDMNFKGKMANLTEPSHLQFDITADNLTLDPIDTKIYTPGLSIPDFSYLGKVYGSFTYKGEPLNFKTTFDVKSTAGNARGFYDMNLTAPNFTYNSSVEASNVNIGKIIKDQSLESDINGRIAFAGSGFSPANVNSKITYEINNTKLYGQIIDKSAGTISLRNYNADLNLSYLAKNLNTEVAGTVNYADIKNPKYNLKGKVNNLNIEDFTKNASDNSNLDFTFDVNGSGISPDNLLGTYNIQLANSFYGKLNLPATPIDVKVSLTGTNNFITLNSNLLDFKAEGSFKVTQIAGVITDNLAQLMNEVSKKFALDTILPLKPAVVNNSAMNFNYEFQTKDPNAINRFIHGLNFDGKISGNIKNDGAGFEAKSLMKINNFSYADSQFVLKNTNADFSFYNDYSANHSNPKGNFTPFTSDLDFTTRSMKVGQGVYDSVHVILDLDEGNQFFYSTAKKDTLLSFAVNGNVDLTEDSINVVIPKITMLYNKVFMQNHDTLLFTYLPETGNNTIRFNKFNIAGDYLKVNLSGYYSVNTESDMTAEVSDLDLPALFKFINNPQGRNDPETVANLNKEVLLGGTIRRMSLNFKGTLAKPVFSFELNSGLLRYQNSKVGRMDAFLDYADNILKTDILVANAQGLGKLRVTGDIPFNNPLVQADSALYSNVMSKSANLVLKAENFQINFFSKLIPNFTELRGILNGDITSMGTISNPVLNGNLNIDKGRFYSQVNGLYYNFVVNSKAENSDLIVDKFSLFYEGDDARHIDAWGKLNFAGLKLNYIDLTTSGDVKILDRSSPTNRFGFYGDMIAGIGTPAVTIKGDLNNLFIAGKLLIKDANLIFPSLQGLAYNVYADNFTYRIITDSTGNNYLDTEIVINPDKINEIDPFLLYSEILEDRPHSALDFVTFDLEVETERNVFVSITFNNLTKEEMFGEIQGKIIINNRTSDKHFQFFGNMNIVGDSYYRYYKNFAITNSAIVFEGDPLNPRLNIHAQYTNVGVVDNNPQTTYVLLEITGTRKEPKLAFSLKDEKGAVTTGGNAQSDALSYLLFGQATNAKLTPANTRSALTSLGSSTGSGILSSLLLGAIRDVAPFIINTEVNYTGGNISSGTDIHVTSQIGGALIKFGGRVLSDINNAEISIDYPLNKLLNINVSNNLILEIYRQIKTGDFTGDRTVYNGVSLIYKINF